MVKVQATLAMGNAFVGPIFPSSRNIINVLKGNRQQLGWMR
jgi:hypothetical protein